MSYDPDLPPREPYDYPPEGPDGAVRERVQLPGTFLICVGVLNLLCGLFFLFRAAQIASIPAADLYAATQEQMKEIGSRFPQMKDAIDQAMADKTPEEVKNQSVLTNGIGGGVIALAAVLTILGGWNMVKLRSRGLSILGSVLAIIPCISCSGCCGLGEIIGIWALVVLMSEEVSRSFQ